MHPPYGIKQAAIEATPAATLLAVGTSLDMWLKVFGLVFLVAQLGYLLWRWRRDWKRDRQGHPPLDTGNGSL